MNRKQLTQRLKLLGATLQQYYFENGLSFDEEQSPFRYASNQFYCLLMLKTGTDLKYRLDILKRARKTEVPQTCLSKLQKLNYVDVILQDSRLSEAALELLTDLIDRYKQEEFIVDINLKDILEDLI